MKRFYDFYKKINELNKFVGDSNPLNLNYIDTWHNAQRLAISGKNQDAINLMLKAADESKEISPGESKYYLGTVAWIKGDNNKCLQYANDKDVINTGNDVVLKRLVASKSKDYKVAYMI